MDGKTLQSTIVYDGWVDDHRTNYRLVEGHYRMAMEGPESILRIAGPFDSMNMKIGDWTPDARLVNLQMAVVSTIAVVVEEGSRMVS